MNDIDTYFPVQYKKSRNQAQKRPLEFLDNAEQTYAQCDRKFRNMSRRLDKSIPTALDFYLSWREECLPAIQTIQRAASIKEVADVLKKRFLLNHEHVATTIRQLQQTAIGAFLEGFVVEQYSLGEKKLYHLAKSFVSQPSDQCDKQIQNYIDYCIYRKIAAEEGLVVYDANARLLHRLLLKIRARRQKRSIIRQAKKRILQIQKEISQIEQLNDGIIARLFSFNIDLVEVLAVRQDYEKALGKLGKKSAESPAKRLALFEKKTESIRSSYLDTIPGVASLADTQKAVKEIDDVLLAIFDFDATQRNALMSQLKRYRDLNQERDRLEQSIR